jgi:ribosomal protein S18 acetylase RimI-like enzyme
MFIRTAGGRDVEAIRTLLTETWHATYDAIYGSQRVAEITADWFSKEALAKRLDMPRSEFLVADDGSRLGGVAFASADATGKTVTLHQLYVHPEMQGRGIGGLLLDEVLESFFEAQKIRLEVEEANERAVAFYTAWGFEPAGRTENCGKAQSGIPALVMERTLTPSGVL